MFEEERRLSIEDFELIQEEKKSKTTFLKKTKKIIFQIYNALFIHASILPLLLIFIVAIVKINVLHTGFLFLFLIVKNIFFYLNKKIQRLFYSVLIFWLIKL